MWYKWSHSIHTWTAWFFCFTENSLCTVNQWGKKIPRSKSYKTTKGKSGFRYHQQTDAILTFSGLPVCSTWQHHQLKGLEIQRQVRDTFFLGEYKELKECKNLFFCPKVLWVLRSVSWADKKVGLLAASGGINKFLKGGFAGQSSDALFRLIYGWCPFLSVNILTKTCKLFPSQPKTRYLVKKL